TQGCPSREAQISSRTSQQQVRADGQRELGARERDRRAARLKRRDEYQGEADADRKRAQANQQQLTMTMQREQAVLPGGRHELREQRKRLNLEHVHRLRRAAL